MSAVPVRTSSLVDQQDRCICGAAGLRRIGSSGTGIHSTTAARSWPWPDASVLERSSMPLTARQTVDHGQAEARPLPIPLVERNGSTA